jgi:hypothetical protein
MKLQCLSSSQPLFTSSLRNSFRAGKPAFPSTSSVAGKAEQSGHSFVIVFLVDYLRQFVAVRVYYVFAFEKK